MGLRKEQKLCHIPFTAISLEISRFAAALNFVVSLPVLDHSDFLPGSSTRPHGEPSLYEELVALENMVALLMTTESVAGGEEESMHSKEELEDFEWQSKTCANTPLSQSNTKQLKFTAATSMSAVEDHDQTGKKR